MKGFLKSKTMWFSGLTAIAGVVQSLAPFIPADKLGAIMTGLGVVGGVLRSVTTQPLAEK